ncbi:antibiotic biosynthesis monooxygenase [Paenibacillus crassostreae]|uniref:Antibiotic biosynthesis monooxygenase n=1 Tax=Paenibacillus crassostreae TaxID=1763538 RepID=A0A167G471_9BACL|nr:antibiotic biosynthesis monooxygenase [Paenibacillus crassostreae]AOZ94826.1 antibiotic biosynthesis monooxygenase [Paenibacillus crassostreae]OAB77198.1 antibiotic biosynthesis monooxygenase [Paenibacillus crassostreae]
MLIQTRTIVVEKGNAEKVVERFSQESPVEGMEGLIDITVMVNKRSKENEEVVVMIRWESEEAWKNWEKSDVHIQGHRQNKGKTSPEFVLSTTVNMYVTQKIKQGKAFNNQ